MSYTFFVSFDLILYVPVNTFSGLPGFNQYRKQGLMCLAQGHNVVMPVRVEPATRRSRVKHSFTEPLRSQLYI